MPTALTRAPIQRRTTDEINRLQEQARSPQASATRDLGTMTSADLNRNPTGSVIGMKPGLTGMRPTSGYNEMQSPPAPQRTTYDQFLQNNPNSPAATGNLATPATRAPQQTERANPLTGDNNRQPESTTAPVQPPGSNIGRSMQDTFNNLRGVTPATRAPFVQRGAGTPRGQDAAVPNEDDAIGGSMAGTQSRIAGSRRFSNPASANIYQSFLQRAFPQTP